ncbi:MAG: hypothetical protein GX456_07905 [Verrucomicrobia bacterium]|nr:hypothetical protein [Verrucomicrobiota bacterium]
MNLIRTIAAFGIMTALLATAQDAGAPVNLAEFAQVKWIKHGNPAEEADAQHLVRDGNQKEVVLDETCAVEIRWDQPRAIRSVEVRADGELQDVPPIKVEWWYRAWPDNGSGGWMKLDDPFNGRWIEARTSAKVAGPKIAIDFLPLDKNEVASVNQVGFEHRLTYKLRVRCANSVKVTGIAAFSDARWKNARLRYEWRKKLQSASNWNPQFEARNAHIRTTKRLGIEVFEVDLAYADAGERLSADRGHVVCRDGETGSFSVFVDDVLREGALFVRDIEVLVSDAERAMTLKTWPGPAGERWTAGTVAEQVARMPEQSFDRLEKAIPQKPPRYLFLGVPNLRQEIALLPRGEIQLRADSLRSMGPDARLRPWEWDDIIFDFGAGEHPVMGPQSNRVVTRSLADGWLPIVHYQWETGQIRYEQTSVATPLMCDIGSLQTETGTETVVLATRFELLNRSQEERDAWLWMEISRPTPCRLTLQNLLVLSRPSDKSHRSGFLPLRCRFDIHDKGALDIAVLEPAGPGSYRQDLPNPSSAREAVRYRVRLAPGERHAIDLFVPYVELMDKQELQALLEMSFTNVAASVERFWRDRVSRGMTYEVPDRYLNELFKANLWHVLISTDIDPFTRQYQHGAATHHYKNYLNETAMVARSLEMRGEHEAAAQLIETFLANQGVKGLPGNFRSKEGVLYAAHPEEPDPYTAQGYNMHHGFGMWAAAEHYLWTRDIRYLARVAPRLLAAADWVINERQSTRITDPAGRRRPEFGLAPAGDLEDVEEYLYYYATDAYYHLGMKRVAQAFAEAIDDASELPAAARPPDRWTSEVRTAAKRLIKETESFRQDIRASVAESVATSPVVRLRDGLYIPYVPSRVYALTHLKEGWIREGLYPALHLVTGEVYEPQHQFVDWMIHELEDNVFISAESGYGLKNPEAEFFDLGGFTLQPNLLDLALVYLARDEIPNFIRAFYNTAWVSLYPDTMCFAEWVPRLGRGDGPLYKTPDECKFVQWMRQMLAFERGDDLELALGVPLAWMRDGQRIRIERAATFFGQLDLEIVSHAASNKVIATVKLAKTKNPKTVRLRLRHPDNKPLKSALVNGRTAEVDHKRQLIELPKRAQEWRVEAFF